MKRLLGTAVVGAAFIVATSAPAAYAATEQAHWRLDEPGTPPVAFDSSGNNNDGTNENVVGNGIGYEFNGRSSRVIVPNDRTLNPGTANFSYSATVVIDTPPAIGETYDVIRKGVTTTSGGEYKLEITRVNGTARARCLVKDAQKVVAAIQAPQILSDGTPHDITCSKTSTGVTVRVDDKTPKTRSVPSLGSVSNFARLGIGAKGEGSASSGFDWFLGSINDARVSVG